MRTLAGVLALVLEPNLVRLALLTRRGKMASEQRAKIRIKCGVKGMWASSPTNRKLPRRQRGIAMAARRRTPASPWRARWTSSGAD